MEQRITAVIVDDEPDCREVLAQLLTVHFPQIDIVGLAANVLQAYDVILQTKPQLVFLDIQMPGANGFNLLKRFPDVTFEVVFVTSYDQYALTAIKFNALDYILKPVSVSDVSNAVKRAIERLANKTDRTMQVVNLLYGLTDETEKKIAVHSGNNVRILHTTEILFIEGDGRYCRIETTGGEKFSMAKLVREFEEYLGPTSSFVRVNKSMLVNALHIKGYSKNEPFFVEMSNGRTLEISRRKKADVLAQLGLMK